MIDNITNSFSLLRENSRDLLIDEETNYYINLAQGKGPGTEEAFSRLIFSNFRLILTTIKPYSSYSSPTLEFEDILAVAIEGFIKAIIHFNPEKGYKFSTYVVTSMRYEIWRALETQSLSMRVPAYLQRQKFKLLKALENFSDKEDNGFASSRINKRSYLEKVTGFPKIKIDKLLSLPKINLYFEDYTHADPDTTYSETIGDTKDDISEIGNIIDRQTLIDYLQGVLTTREFFVLVNYFGLSGYETEARTYESIASELGITRERVRQNLSDALVKLKSKEHRPLLSNLLTGNGKYK